MARRENRGFEKLGLKQERFVRHSARQVSSIELDLQIYSGVKLIVSILQDYQSSVDPQSIRAPPTRAPTCSVVDGTTVRRNGSRPVR
jgi:hypothetical protein